MALPEQVRRRAERANELIAQMANGQQPGGGEPTDPPAPAPNDPPQDPPAPAPVVDPPAATPAPAPADPPAPTPAPAPAEPPEDWKQKYLTLQGVFNAESRRWNGEKQQMEARIAALETAAKQPPVAAPAAPAQSQVDFTPEEMERFGPEILNLVASKAAAIADRVVTAKMAELKPTLEQTQQQVQQIGKRVYESKEQEFWGELADKVPDHQQVNADPRWLQWLGEEDEMSGVPRQVLLDKHAANLDHVRVIKMFNAFKKAAGIETPPATPPAPPAPPAGAPAPAMPPISPSPRAVGNATAATPREPQAATVKRSEISAHYRRSATDPTYRASQEYRDMEQRIAQATATNRVVEG